MVYSKDEIGSKLAFGTLRTLRWVYYVCKVSKSKVLTHVVFHLILLLPVRSHGLLLLAVFVVLSLNHDVRFLSRNCFKFTHTSTCLRLFYNFYYCWMTKSSPNIAKIFFIWSMVANHNFCNHTTSHCFYTRMLNDLLFVVIALSLLE